MLNLDSAAVGVPLPHDSAHHAVPRTTPLSCPASACPSTSPPSWSPGDTPTYRSPSPPPRGLPRLEDYLRSLTPPLVPADANASANASVCTGGGASASAAAYTSVKGSVSMPSLSSQLMGSDDGGGGALVARIPRSRSSGECLAVAEGGLVCGTTALHGSVSCDGMLNTLLSTRPHLLEAADRQGTENTTASGSGSSPRRDDRASRANSMKNKLVHVNAPLTPHFAIPPGTESPCGLQEALLGIYDAYEYPVIPMSECKASLTLSSTKIYKYGSYWMQLDIATEYRKMMNITEQEIRNSGLGAQCRRIGNSQEPTVCNICCPSKSVVAVTGVLPKMLSSDGKTEQYQFTLKSNCSSSRDHLKSTLVMEYRLAPKLFVVSPTFVLRARKKPSKPAPKRACTETSKQTSRQHISPPPSIPAIGQVVSSPDKVARNFSLLDNEIKKLHARLQTQEIEPHPTNKGLSTDSPPQLHRTPHMENQDNVTFVRWIKVEMREQQWLMIFVHIQTLMKCLPNVDHLESKYFASDNEDVNETGVVSLRLFVTDTQSVPTAALESTAASFSTQASDQAFALLAMYFANTVPGYANLMNCDMLSSNLVTVINDKNE
ncbi:hypothetical protein Pelo_2484 [Pelomyxa schiedti]|nr:hypothetical protein Pelo_2484 [Pelomyxa schiedti]